MEELDRRIAWVREKVCTALGTSEDEFLELGVGHEEQCNTVKDLKTLLDSEHSGGCIFYTLTDLKEIEVEGTRVYLHDSYPI
jgi:hypothetical protein